MIFEVISMKRTKIKMAIMLFALVFFAIAAIINIYFESLHYSNIIMIIALVLFLFVFLTPIMLLGDKVIGKLELTNSFISFQNEEEETIKIDLSEIKFCEFKYQGFKGEPKLTMKGFVFESGINYLKINTDKQKYKIAFLIYSSKEKNSLTNYIEILNANYINCKS
jgi:hypothetical protein